MVRVTVTYTMQCGVAGCEAVASQYWGALSCQPGMRMPEPVLPEEWREVGDLLVCPRHTLKITVDGEDVFV